MKLQVYTDGGSLNNPGQAAIAYVIYANNSLLMRRSKRIGVATNNVAEYTALIEALVNIKKLLVKKRILLIEVFSDSQLMVNQLNGTYKIKDGNLHDLVTKVRILESEINLPIIYRHILRDKNQLADSLIKKELSTPVSSPA